MKKRSWSRGATCVLILGALVSLLASTGWASDEVEIGPQVGQMAPDFTLPALDGDEVTLSEQVEQYDVILLYFFFAAT